MTQMVLSNETVLIEQYANDRGPGWGSGRQSPPEAKTHLAFGRSMKAANLPAFLLLARYVPNVAKSSI